MAGFSGFNYKDRRHTNLLYKIIMGWGPFFHYWGRIFNGSVTTPKKVSEVGGTCTYSHVQRNVLIALNF
jgi:hypothetical protein